MLQIRTNSLVNSGYKFDLLGTIMPTAKDAEWLLCVCLNTTGSSGNLGPCGAVRIRV